MINKTFTFAGKAWALGARGKETFLLRQVKTGEYERASGLERSTKEAFEYALKHWPEHLERPE